MSNLRKVFSFLDFQTRNAMVVVNSVGALLAPLGG